MPDNYAISLSFLLTAIACSFAMNPPGFVGGDVPLAVELIG